MADIRLAKPAAGTTQTVPSAPDGRFIFDFPADAATLTRSGDNLVLTFEDGASIQLQDFYTTYSKEEMPSFQVEGVEISGQDFFAALGEDLMPAAGPAAGSSASRSGRYNEYGGSDLLDGLDHLGRLDIGFDGGVQLATDTVEPSPYYEDDHGVTVTPSAPGTDPDDPDIPVQGEDFPPTMPHDVLQVDESALDGGSGGGSATADGSMSVSAPDGVATITIGGVVVWQNGALTGNPVQTDEGHLDVTGFDGTNLTYTYTLDKATQEHGKEGGGENDAIAHEMEVVVTDSDGDSGSAVIRVEITDDVPVAYDDMNSLTEVAESVSGNVLDNDESGADGWRTDADGNIAAVVLSGSAEGTYGELTLNADGSYTYTRNETGVPDGGASDTFTYIAYDADGDAVEKTLTITIENTDPTAPGGEGHTLTVTLSDAKTAGGNTDTVSQSVDLFDGPEAFTSAVFGSTENIVVSGGESFTWSLSDGKLIGIEAESDAMVTLEITGITPDGTVTVSATLDDPAHHNDGSNSLNISGIVITATDAGSSTVPGTMNVVVTDDAVDVEVINNNASLTVDESYADSITGSGLELESSAKADTTSLNVSSLFSVDAGADGEASREYALSISNNPTGQKVLVDGSQYDLTLVKNSDGSISGVAGDGNGTVIFNITISSDGNVTLDMTGHGSLVHPHRGSTAQKHDEALSITGVEVTLTVTDTDGDSDSASADLVLAFEDDGPRLTVITDEVPDAPDTSVRNLGSGEAFPFVPDTPEKPDASDYERGEEDPEYLAALQEYDTEITAAKQKAEDMAGQLVESDILSQNGWEGVSIYAGKVTYNTDGTVDQLTRPSDYCLKYAEKLLITFYKGSEIVESRFVDSVDIGSSNTGKVTYSTDLIAGGFDKVVVSAVLGENDRESSFTLQGVDFVTAPLAIAVASGELDVASGADGYAEDFAVANVQFAMEQMFTLQDDGTYSLSILDGNNDSKSAIVTVIIDDLGNSRLTATVDGKELFSATLEKDGGSWSWKMEQYQEFLVQGKDGQLGNLELGFITMDGDDDTATETVNIPLKNLPDLAVSQTTLVTDESYINGLGSETGPAGGDDGQADSAKASGTMSVKTYGKEGKLILTIGEEEHPFLLDTDGKLSESLELTVLTTYGQLTLQNGEAPGTIIYTYTQTKPYNHLSKDGPDQLAENAESFTVKVVDGGGNESGSATITVSIEDDAPMFSEKSLTVDVANESEKYWSYGEKIEFTSTEASTLFEGEHTVKMQCGENTLSLYVGKIQFDANGNIDKSKDWITFIDRQGTFHINGEGKEHGIGVHSNYNGGVDNSKIYTGYDGRKNEIGYDPISNQSEAVIINLDKPAVNMNIDLSMFFSDVGSDTNPEEAIFLFYKDGKWVGESHLSSNETSGDVQQNGFEALPAGGFDTVVIAAGDNGTDPDKVWDNSEFNISAITFNTFEGVDRTLTGKLDATSADGIKGYSVDTDKLANLELTSDNVPINYSWNADTGTLLATAEEETVFKLVLNTETGAWTMVQYKEYEGELELPFTATDGDDDSTSISVEIPATGAERGTYKVTDSDAEKAVLAAAEQEMKSAVRSGEALATAAVLAGMATVLPDEVPAVEGDRPDTPDETLVAAPAEAADAPAALSFFEEGAALPDSPVEGMDDTPLLFANLALAGQEELMVSAAQTDAADGPLWADVSGTDDTPDATMSGIATSGPGAAPAGTAVPEIVLTGTDGDDILLGGDGDELIFGGSGDDFIDGGAGRDTIYAGAGNDIIVYDQQDYLVSGGNGIDFMVSDDTSLTLDGLLSNTSSDKPLVSGIEVLLKGEDALSLTSINDLADRYGITLGVNEAGEETLQLDDRWTKQDDGSYDFNGGAEADGGLTLETSLTPVETGDPASEAVQQQVFTLEHSNG